jgi:hypothetical protein
MHIELFGMVLLNVGAIQWIWPFMHVVNTYYSYAVMGVTRYFCNALL